MLGFACGVIGGVIHVAILPYCDLVLLSTTSCLSIVFSNILAIKFLNEKLVWKYDLASFLLIVLGCSGIVLLSKADETPQTPEVIKGNLSSAQTILFLLMFIVIVVLSLVMVKALTKATAQFESHM